MKYRQFNLSIARMHTKSQFIDSKADSSHMLDKRSQSMINVLQNIREKPIIPRNTKKVVLDFSSPNIGKPFHVGHLRSTIIGNFVANINDYFQNNVTRINYVGDWGTQFGLLHYGLKTKNIDVTDLKQNPMKTLYSAYVDANTMAQQDKTIYEEVKNYFADIEQGKADLKYWKKIREITIQELAKVYQRLGIHFDEYHWESDYNGATIAQLIDFLEKEQIIKQDHEGKKVARVGNRNVTVVKSNHTSLYLSRDIAAVLDRYKTYNFDEMLYIVDKSQSDHFAALFDIVKRIDEKCALACHHIKFGRIQGMSTRNGNVVFLDDILDEAKEKMYEKQQKSKNTRTSAMDERTCDILGASAVIINDFKQRRQKDYVFEWDNALQSEGDSGIKLQYLHCRLWSLEQNCNINLPDHIDPNYLPESIISDVVAELSKFDEILIRSKNDYEPCIIVAYLFRLAKVVNRMFKEINVKNADADLAAQRLLVFHSARLVVKRSLEILGIRPLNEM